MRSWKGKENSSQGKLTVAQAASAGASRGELVQAAMRVLRESVDADRIGVWVEESPGAPYFQGIVWDSLQKPMPEEWMRLSPGAALLPEFSARTRSFEQELSNSQDSPAFGPLVEMRRALWAPMEGQGRQLGLLLAASRSESATFPRQAVESIAAELGLALRLEEVEVLARRRYEELSFAARILAEAGSEADAKALLSEIAQQGIESAGVGFLAIGQLTGKDGAAPMFAWTGGETRWSAQLGSESVQSLWRRALEAGCAVGTDGAEAMPKGGCSRWVALPLSYGGRQLGILVAGLREDRSRLAALEWLERRAAFASSVLARMRIREREPRRGIPAAGAPSRTHAESALTADHVFKARLEQAEKLAALGRMVSGIAHELSNPLTSILGYAQRLLRRREFAQSEEVKNIYQEAGRGARMLRKLLQSGRVAGPERKPVSLNQVVLRALEFLRFGLSADRTKVEVELDPEVPRVLGDADQLQQVVTNLVDNAQHAIELDRGHGTIRVATRRTREGGVELEVADDGPGIPEGLLPRIFDPFFTTKPSGVGTGLGLSIVLNIVREHGGQVHAANRPGRGAVFAVDLPAIQQVPAPAQRPDVESEFDAVPPAQMPGAARGAEPVPAHVLIVEDEPTVANLIGDVLRDEGMQVEVLLGGRDALARSIQRSYDLVICDLRMPGLDGQQFYEALARMGSPLCSRFVFVTGDALSGHTLEFLRSHRVPYVHKPFLVEELMRVVFRVLRTDGTEPARSAVTRNHS